MPEGMLIHERLAAMLDYLQNPRTEQPGKTDNQDEPQKERSWERSPKYLGLGWQNVAEALGHLMETGEPQLSERARQDVEARLRAAADFIARPLAAVQSVQ